MFKNTLLYNEGWPTRHADIRYTDMVWRRDQHNRMETRAGHRNGGSGAVENLLRAACLLARYKADKVNFISLAVFLLVTPILYVLLKLLVRSPTPQ